MKPNTSTSSSGSAVQRAFEAASPTLNGISFEDFKTGWEAAMASIWERLPMPAFASDPMTGREVTKLLNYVQKNLPKVPKKEAKRGKGSNEDKQSKATTLALAKLNAVIPPPALYLSHRAPSVMTRVGQVLRAAETRPEPQKRLLIRAAARILFLEGALDGTEGLEGAEDPETIPSKAAIRRIEARDRLANLAKENILRARMENDPDRGINNLEQIFGDVDEAWRTWTKIAKNLKGENPQIDSEALDWEALRDASVHLIRGRNLVRNKRMEKTSQADLDQRYFGSIPKACKTPRVKAKKVRR